ncbi:MAG: MJ1255/VC2487 family glycosyltransferase [Nanoarchaeota archaeon]|nr:MJ1255/VC2487 family glycosyltransferase [Nanoarchaeota archaeon]
MARILYALSGEGMGHAIRSQIVIKKLQKDHNMLIACGGKAYHHLDRHFDKVIHVQSLHIGYKNNKVSSWKTFFINIGNLFSHFSSFKFLYITIKRFKPDIIINDFEYITNYLSFLMGIPNIIIDNQQIIVKSRIRFSKKLRWDFIKSWLVVRFIVPKADFSFITSFFFPQLKIKNAAYCLPVIREEIRKVKTKTKDYILVYQTSKTNKKLLRILKQSGNKFKIYGFGIIKTKGNLEFKEFNEKEFIKDLAESKAVIINGGFTVMSEALYLMKPILAIPIEKQFEQELNALYLQRLGYGMNTQKATSKVVAEFVDRIPEFREKLVAYSHYDNELFFEQLGKKIDVLIKNKK